MIDTTYFGAKTIHLTKPSSLSGGLTKCCMKAFLIKYKNTIGYLALMIFLLLYFVPLQSDYYLETDVDTFNEDFLTPFLIWTVVLTVLGIFVHQLYKFVPTEKAVKGLLFSALKLGLFCFFFQSVFLAAFLFLNRQYTRFSFDKQYKIEFMVGTPETRDNMVAYDLVGGESTTDSRLLGTLYTLRRGQNDTIAITVGNGLFGIPFYKKRLIRN